MGSFNVQCFASKQTISEGDDCVIIPIKQNLTYDNFSLEYERNGKTVKTLAKGVVDNCYFNSYWDCAGPLLYGKYNDYGSFVLNDTPENNRLISMFLNSLRPDVPSVVESDGVAAFDFEKLVNFNKKKTHDDLQEIFNVLIDQSKDGKLFFTGNSSIPVPLTFAVMHKATADYLIGLTECQKDESGNVFNMKEKFHDYANNKKNSMLKILKNGTLREKAAFCSVNITNLEGFLTSFSVQNFNFFYETSGLIINNLANEVENSQQNPMDKKVLDETFNYLKDLIQHIYIFSGLNKVSAKLEPMVTVGQDYKNHVGNQTFKMIQHVNKKINQDIKEKYEEINDAPKTRRKKSI